MKRTKDFNTNKGITLIALVITIIVMLILVGVTISMAVNGGLFDYAGKATGETKNALNAEQELANGGIEVDGVWYNSIDEYLNKDKDNNVEKISKEQSYVGYYADVDGDGTVDGVIYADLAFSKEGSWGNWGDSYSYEAVPAEELKNYYISGIETANFYEEAKEVLTATGEGEDRFYVMALEDFTEAGYYYCWYDAASDGDGMTDYATYTSTAFGKGKANTTAMITKWNNAGYGAKDDNGTYKDVWGQIQTLASKGWFVPSGEEWLAFADAFDVIGEWDENWENFTMPYGLSYYYYSSSQEHLTSAYCMRFYDESGDGGAGVMNSYEVFLPYSVRLSTTF